MDNDKAREELTKLRDSLNEVLGTGRSNISKADAEKAVVEAKKGVKRLRKSLLERVKDLPVINQATQLGAAGSVAVATAAVTQTNIAVQETEVFVASVANDVVEERFIPPAVFNRFVDFPELNDWGQRVMQEKVESVRQEIARTEAKIAPTKDDSTPNGTKPTPEPQKDAEEPPRDESLSIDREEPEKETKDQEVESKDKEPEEKPKPEPKREDKAKEEDPQITPEEELDPEDPEGLKPGSDLILTPPSIEPNSPAS